VTQLLIDADTHLTEPADLWTSRVPAKYVDQVPTMVRDKAGRDIWVFNGDQIGVVGMTATAGWPTPFPDGPATMEECPPAAHDAAARLAYMDDLGIWAQVLYPNVAGFGSQRFLTSDDPELKLLCVQAYNDFLRDWASIDDRRFVTIMATPFWDIDEAVAEVERCVDTGHRGILFTGEPQRFDLPYLGESHWDPLWSVAQEAGLAIHFHIGGGDPTTSFTPKRIRAHGTAATYAYTATELFLKNGLQTADLLTSGVLPRFPDLKFVSVESGIGWVPFVLEAADYAYLEGRPDRTSEWELMPSEYFARQVYACYWFETVAPKRLLDEIPVDRILFETDYPHPTCLFGDVREQIDRSLADATEEQRHKILWENAAQLYRIDAPGA
jgi:predicted TIM-barrel fold metal-dependent hydrolase